MNPYESLPDKSFWKTAVSDRNPLEIEQLWQPKFRIPPKRRIITAGSCFAQHFGAELAQRGYAWFDAEPAPPYLTGERGKKYGYGVFSARTGNIYTARTWLQWLRLAFGQADAAQEIWEKDGRFYDPLRPRIEPNGFASAEEVLEARRATLASLRDAVNGASIVVFTMGLTESWRNTESGFEYAMCPGTVAGEFDADKHVFHNATHAEILQDMRRCLKIVRGANRGRRKQVLLTVSPVPLVATATGEHVLTSGSYSKSVLRAVAGQLREELPYVDYFPSYEILTSPVFRGFFFKPNMRAVSPEGVAFVMRQFFADQKRTFGSRSMPAERPVAEEPENGSALDEVHCDEEFLNTFAKG